MGQFKTVEPQRDVEPFFPRRPRGLALKRGVVAGMISIAPLVGEASQGPEGVLGSIYGHHRPWSGREIALDDPSALSRYFDPGLVELLTAEDACRSETGELCNLGFDPIYCAQDFEEGLVDLSFARLSSVPVTYAVTFTNLGTRSVVYTLDRTDAGWRVSDIQCPEGPSLRELLSQPVSE